MGFSIIFLLIFITLVGIYSFVLLSLNKTHIHLDLLFLEIDLQLGYILLTSFLFGILIAIVCEIIFFSFKRRTKDE